MPAEFDRSAAWDRVVDAYYHGKPACWDDTKAAFLRELAAAERAARESESKRIADTLSHEAAMWQALAAKETVANKKYAYECLAAVLGQESKKLAADPAARTGGT